jgi:hypothetical protein
MSITTTAMPVTTDIIPVTTDNSLVECTMEYAPVCWVNWKTYSNKCMAEAAAKIDVGYEWECIIKSKLSAKDESFYNTIKNRLDNKYQVAVNNTTIKYIKNLEKYSSIKKERINNKIISLLDSKISELLLKYPQDVALSEKVNNVYSTLKLFKFELMKLEF